VKFEKIKPGMLAYDVGRQKLGNTTLSTVAVWSVKIISVDAENRTVEASWNYNPARTYSEREYKKWREAKPTLVEGFFGDHRLATKDETQAARRAAEEL